MKNTIDLWCEGQPLENIRFSGGEPTYHRNIVDIVQYATNKGIKRVAISTNGSNKIELYDKLLAAGCNDFSISLDAADPVTGDAMAGNIIGAWDKVARSIRYLSDKTYVTVGVVLTPENINNFIEIVSFADSLGVADIRVIPSAQWDQPLPELADIDPVILDRHPILKYRVAKFLKGSRVRGILEEKTSKCPLVMDDSVVAGQDHYPCVIYMREQGLPIGKVGSGMRKDRIKWYNDTDTHKDPICKKNCLDVCVDFNNKVMSRSAVQTKRGCQS
jgi:MoaA/NifB/PqqE/SkfB family radical SAM enzyme